MLGRAHEASCSGLTGVGTRIQPGGPSVHSRFVPQSRGLFPEPPVPMVAATVTTPSLMLWVSTAPPAASCRDVSIGGRRELLSTPRLEGHPGHDRRSDIGAQHQHVSPAWANVRPEHTHQRLGPRGAHACGTCRVGGGLASTPYVLVPRMVPPGVPGPASGAYWSWRCTTRGLFSGWISLAPR